MTLSNCGLDHKRLRCWRLSLVVLLSMWLWLFDVVTRRHSKARRCSEKQLQSESETWSLPNLGAVAHSRDSRWVLEGSRIQRGNRSKAFFFNGVNAVVRRSLWGFLTVNITRRLDSDRYLFFHFLFDRKSRADSKSNGLGDQAGVFKQSLNPDQAVCLCFFSFLFFQSPSNRSAWNSTRTFVYLASSRCEKVKQGESASDPTG